MSDNLRDSLMRIAEKMVILAAEDEQLRNDLQAVALAVVELSNRKAVVTSAVVPTEEASAPTVDKMVGVVPVAPEAIFPSASPQP